MNECLMTPQHKNKLAIRCQNKWYLHKTLKITVNYIYLIKI